MNSISKVVTLVIESVACCTLLETKMYIREFGWYLQFGVIYILLDDATLFKLFRTLKEYHDKSILYLNMGDILCQVNFAHYCYFIFPIWSLFLDIFFEEHEACIVISVEYALLPAGSRFASSGM